jgi:hypothetical protein
MITEANALEIAQSDAQKLYGRLEAGAMPDDVGRAVIGRILTHVDRFGRERASKRAREAAAKRMTAPTFSEHLVARCMGVAISAMKSLPPEDSRALALWLIGAPPQVPGFLKHVIAGLSETSGMPAVEQAEAQMMGLLNRMQKLDDDLFQNQIRSLSIPRQRIIRGLLMDAQWAFNERDGGTARSRVISARKIAQRWLREHERQQTALGH